MVAEPAGPLHHLVVSSRWETPVMWCLKYLRKMSSSQSRRGWHSFEASTGKLRSKLAAMSFARVDGLPIWLQTSGRTGSASGLDLLLLRRPAYYWFDVFSQDSWISERKSAISTLGALLKTKKIRLLRIAEKNSDNLHLTKSDWTRLSLKLS